MSKPNDLPKVAQALWKRISSTDTWFVEYVYEDGARKIWDAAIRYERRRSKRRSPGGLGGLTREEREALLWLIKWCVEYDFEPTRISALERLAARDAETKKARI